MKRRHSSWRSRTAAPTLIVGIVLTTAAASAQEALDEPEPTGSFDQASSEPPADDSPSEAPPTPSESETESEEATPDDPSATDDGQTDAQLSSAVSVEQTLAPEDNADDENEEDNEDDEDDEVDEVDMKKGWKFGLSGYFRAPMAIGLSPRPGPDDPTGEPEMQVSYGPTRTVDANYFSFAYTRLQEQDWVELFVSAERKHVKATIGWMGYWLQGVGFRNPDAGWAPAVAYLTLDTDFNLGNMRPNIALSGGAWWPRFGRHEKYDTFTLGQYRQLGEQLKLTLPFAKHFTTTVVQGFGTGRDGSFNYGVQPPYQAKVGLNLLHYLHLQFNYKELLEVGLHHNVQVTRDPNLLQQTSEGKSYSNAREGGLATVGGEVKLNVPRAGSLWVSPSFVRVKNGWALGEGGVEVVHSLSPEGVAVNYLGWSGSPQDSTGTGSLFNVGFLYENTLSNIMGRPKGGSQEVTVNAFGLLVDAKLALPEGSGITQDRITQLKWGADVEYNPWKWIGLMLRYDVVNYDLDHGGYIFNSISPRISFYSNYLSGERIYLQYSRYNYGDNMTLAGRWPWGTPLVAGSDIIQGGPYAGSKPDMDVIKFQADVSF